MAASALFPKGDFVVEYKTSNVSFQDKKCCKKRQAEFRIHQNSSIYKGIYSFVANYGCLAAPEQRQHIPLTSSEAPRTMISGRQSGNMNRALDKVPPFREDAPLPPSRLARRNNAPSPMPVPRNAEILHI